MPTVYECLKSIESRGKLYSLGPEDVLGGTLHGRQVMKDLGLFDGDPKGTSGSGKESHEVCPTPPKLQDELPTNRFLKAKMRAAIDRGANIAETQKDNELLAEFQYLVEMRRLHKAADKLVADNADKRKLVCLPVFLV